MRFGSIKINNISEGKKLMLITFPIVVFLILLIAILILFSPKLTGDRLREKIVNDIKNELTEIMGNLPTEPICNKGLSVVDCSFYLQNVYYTARTYTNIRSEIDSSEPVITDFYLGISIPSHIDYDYIDYNKKSRVAREVIEKIKSSTKLENLKLEKVEIKKYLLYKTKINSNERTAVAQAFVFATGRDRYKTYFDFNLDEKIDESTILDGLYEKVDDEIGLKLIEGMGFTKEQYLREVYNRWGYTNLEAEEYLNVPSFKPIPNTEDEFFHYFTPSSPSPNLPFSADCYDANAWLFFKNNDYSVIVCVGGLNTRITIKPERIN